MAPGRPVSGRTFLAWCALILLIGGGFRFHRLGQRSLWLDEAKTANISAQSISDVVAKTRRGGSSPVVYPLLLHLVEWVDRSALGVRLISAVASLAALAAVLALPLVGVGRETALIAGAILAVSPSQIRYAQEVREYSLSVLIAAVMVLALAGCMARRGRSGLLFVVVLFVAPLVQYGLVFVAVALILVVVFATRKTKQSRSTLWLAAAGTAALAAGSVVTFLLTLRGQWRHTAVWYLESSFFDGSILDPQAVLAFLGQRVMDLTTYLTLGKGAIVLAVPAIGLLLLTRRAAPLASKALFGLAVVSLAATAAAALAHLYPLGPIRQDLFLAPGIALALGAGWEALTEQLPGRIRGLAMAVFAGAVLVAGAWGTAHANPYQEIEDIRSVIAGLQTRTPGDAVYVYYGAWPALRFEGIAGPGFVYGTSHRGNPAGYAVEFRALVGPQASPVWLVFAHVYRGEDRRLLADLGPHWSFETVVSAPGASLVRAYRRTSHDGEE